MAAGVAGAHELARLIARYLSAASEPVRLTTVDGDRLLAEPPRQTSPRPPRPPKPRRSWLGGAAAAVVGSAAVLVVQIGAAPAETVSRQWVTAGIFDVLGVKPLVGRSFTDEDDRIERNAVVLSESFWRSRYNGDPAIVGKEVRLDGDMFAIVGVVPDAAALIEKAVGANGLYALINNAAIATPALSSIRSQCPSNKFNASGQYT